MRLTFLKHWTHRFRRELALISGLSLASAGATLVLPWLVARLAGGVAGEKAIDLEQTLMLLALALVALTITTIAVTILSERAAGQILASLRKKTHERLMAMPMNWTCNGFVPVT